MTRTLAVLTLALAVLANPRATFAQNAHDLLQQALRKERVEGDLPAAIALYRRILAEHPGERAVVASALVQLGRATEVRDPVEAQRLYEQVVSGYGDEAAAAATARGRLAALRDAAGAGTGPQQRLTEIPVPWPDDFSELSTVVALSNDGTRIAHLDGDGDLAVHDLRTERSTKLVGGEGGVAWYPVWSPDDRRIAYQRVSASGKRDIEIVTIATREVRATGVSGTPRSWARDGTILALEPTPRVPHQPARLLAEAGGAERSVDVSYIPYDLPALSPDGAYLAYAGSVEGNVDIYVAPTAGGEHVRVTRDPGVDARPLWSPDGAHLVFKSDRRLNRMGLWAVAMDGGRPAGEPVLVRTEVGEGEPISWSRDGKLLFSTLRSVAHVYSVDVAPPFELRGSARRLTESPDWNREPFVSPDGTRIVYHASSGNQAGAAGRVLRVMDADGGGGRDVVADLQLPYRALVGWLDTEEVVVVGPRRSGPERGIYAVSTTTGALRPILVDDAVRGIASLSPDRSRLVFLYGREDPRFHVIGTDGTGLAPVTCPDAPDGLRPGVPPHWSPDGRWITYVGQGRNGVLAVDVTTGEQRRLVVGDSLTRYLVADWTPDGRHLVYGAIGPDQNEPSSAWLVPVDGSAAPVRVRSDVPGVPEQSVSPTGLFFTFYEDWQWTPDGSAAVFTVNTVAGQGWLMEGFLPRASGMRE